MKAIRLALLTSAVLLAPASLAFSQECAKQPVTVGFLPKLDTDPYFKVAQQGAEQAAKEIGGKTIQVAPSQATAEAQIEFINSLVSQKVGVIAISANDANAVAPALKRAAQQGVKVVSYDSDVAGAAQDIWWNVSDLGYLTYQAAQALAQCKITGKEGDRFTAGRLGEYTIGAGGELILGPAKIVTPENLAEFKF